MSIMGGIYFILKTFGGSITLDFERNTTRFGWNCDWRGINRRRRHRWRSWGILTDRSIRSGTRY